MLEIRNLHAKAGNNGILRGVDLTVNAGEVHAVMGPNGSGKSTLAQVLAGRADYEVTAGEVVYEGKDLLTMPPEDRAREGIFLGFQYPVEIPGVSTTYFLGSSGFRVGRPYMLWSGSGSRVRVFSGVDALLSGTSPMAPSDSW